MEFRSIQKQIDLVMVGPDDADGKMHHKFTSRAGFALDLQTCAVSVSDMINNRKAESGAASGARAGGISSKEAFGEAGYVFFFNTYPGVPDAKVTTD